MNREFPFRRQLAQCSCQVDILRALRSPLASNHKYVINVVLYVHNRTRRNLPTEPKKKLVHLCWMIQMLISSLTDFTVVCDIVEVKEHLGGRERLSQVLLYSVYYTLRNHAQKYFSSDYPLGMYSV